MKPFSEYLSREERRSVLRDEQWRIERNRRRTREERKTQILAGIVNVILVVLFIIVTAGIACTDATSSDVIEPADETIQEDRPTTQIIRAEVLLANVDVHKEAQEPVTYEDHFRAVAKKVENCKLTHYCTELYPHICGTGDGLTSTQVPVTAYWTCAVDPDVIPYGAEVMVDYGDEVQFWKAQDCGAWVKGNHIDLAVETHAEADELGIRYAAVYWAIPEDLDARF